VGLNGDWLLSGLGVLLVLLALSVKPDVFVLDLCIDESATS